MTFEQYRKELEARLANATPGPWNMVQREPQNMETFSHTCLTVEGNAEGVALIDADSRHKNAPLIAHAPQDLRILLEVIDIQTAWIDDSLNLPAGSFDAILAKHLGEAGK